MGANQSGGRSERRASDEEVNFDHFQILRAIGKGSFGKVCIVQKKDTKQMFAMKYVSKIQCMERDAMRHVAREVEILASLEHPFLVNLWFSFQDEEDLFMVSDLLIGGDLRYHVSQEVPFSEDCVVLYVVEIGLALDYLRSKRIVHRDIKPDNILLDEEGHAHITDFNIATVLEEGQLATSMSGTKPYMAPEVFACSADECPGYGCAVDWWSLGVVAYEMLHGVRPFDIHAATPLSEVRRIISTEIRFPPAWHRFVVHLIKKLLTLKPENRISSVRALKEEPSMQGLDFDAVLHKRLKPPFTPPKDHLNCDPTFELEEMIIESRPLHKKKKRLAKQRSLRETQGTPDSPGAEIDHFATFHMPFLVYNRQKELERRERERKEKAWEKELELAMDASEPITPPRRDTTSSAFSSTSGVGANETKTSRPPLGTVGGSTCLESLKEGDEEIPVSLEFIDRTPSPQSRAETPSP